MAFLTMDVLSEPHKGSTHNNMQQQSRVVFMYRLVPGGAWDIQHAYISLQCGAGPNMAACGAAAGYAASSFAVHCAHLAGMHADILARASHVPHIIHTIACSNIINTKPPVH